MRRRRLRKGNVPRFASELERKTTKGPARTPMAARTLGVQISVSCAPWLRLLLLAFFGGLAQTIDRETG